MQDPGFIVPGIHLPPSWVNKASRRAEADLNYRTARCSKRISWAPSLRTAWNASSGSFVFRELHAHQRSDTTYALGQGSAPC
jgi:hypothetical protein